MLNKNILIHSNFNFKDIATAWRKKAQAKNFELKFTSSKPDLVVIALDLKELFPEFFYELLPMPCAQIKLHCDEALETIYNLANKFGKNNIPVLIHNFYYPASLETGIFDYQNSAGQMIWVDDLNKKLVEYAEEQSNVYIFNLQHYLFKYGAQNAGTCPFSAEFNSYLADQYLFFLHTLFYPKKKCLVVDLDNTLWGGIIAEDGLDGIQVKAYGEIQRTIKKYLYQGVLLAINSKNNEEDAVQVFEKHPDMVLKLSDFAVRRINWNDKASNLQEIAQELNIAPDSMVFVDDTDFEIEAVQKMLPEVETIKFDTNPEADLTKVQNISSFAFLRFTEEDEKRNEQYQAQVRRRQLEAKFDSLEEFYFSLQMQAEIKPASSEMLHRLAQLTQKTNQFNLTTKRYTEADLTSMLANDKYQIYTLRLIDKFGDNGLTGLAIIKQATKAWEIDSFLLSCRIIGRGAEQALLSFVQNQALTKGINKLIGHYIPTDRNNLIRNFYQQNGFEFRNKDWILDNNRRKIGLPSWIKLI